MTPPPQLLFRKSLPRSTVERGTLYFWEHAVFNALDDFAKVPGHVRVDNLAKHSQSIQVGAEGRTYTAKYMKRYNNSNGPFRAIEIKSMIRDLRIRENDKIEAFVTDKGMLLCTIIRDRCVLCGAETNARPSVPTMSCARKGCSTSCHARCAGLRPDAGDQWFCPDHLNAVLGLGGSRHSKTVHVPVTSRAHKQRHTARLSSAESTVDLAALALVRLSSPQGPLDWQQQEQQQEEQQEQEQQQEEQQEEQEQQEQEQQEVVVNSDDVLAQMGQAAGQSESNSGLLDKPAAYEASPASSNRNDTSHHSSGTHPTGYSAGDAAPNGRDTAKGRKRKFGEMQAGSDGCPEALHQRILQLELMVASLEAELMMERRARKSAEHALQQGSQAQGQQSCKAAQLEGRAESRPAEQCALVEEAPEQEVPEQGQGHLQGLEQLMQVALEAEQRAHQLAARPELQATA